jgi:hypothetical protein
MSRPEVLIHNIETNEIIVREMNDKELAQFNWLRLVLMPMTSIKYAN